MYYFDINYRFYAKCLFIIIKRISGQLHSCPYGSIGIVKEGRSSRNTANSVGEQTQLSHANASHSVSKVTMLSNLPPCVTLLLFRLSAQTYNIY